MDGSMGIHGSGDAPSQLQQLREKILQAVPALPPELQKQLEADGTAKGVNSLISRFVFVVNIAAHDSRPIVQLLHF